ncbi:hypothetical protein HT105_23770, partial [Bacteroides fragilis]|nr:hypothetical protein [Bacteroides fragilis]
VGEQSRKEGGKVFGSGSRNTVAIIIAVKREIPDDVCIHYRDIGDYLSADEKLAIVDRSTLDNVDWQIIVQSANSPAKKAARYSVPAAVIPLPSLSPLNVKSP